MYCTVGNSETAAAAATNDDDDDDDDDDADTLKPASHTSQSYATLSAAVGRLKSLAVSLSHRLSDSERLHIAEDVSATLNILLNSRRRTE